MCITSIIIIFAGIIFTSRQIIFKIIHYYSIGYITLNCLIFNYNILPVWTVLQIDSSTTGCDKHLKSFSKIYCRYIVTCGPQ